MGSLQPDPNPIIVALDGMDLKQSLAVAELLKGVPGVWGMKVNDLMACPEGACGVIAALKKVGHKVFADAKIHDIPETASRWTARYRDAGADFVTVHAGGGPKMVSACVAASGGMRVLAVTVLTSIDEGLCKRVFGASPKEEVLDLVDLLREGEHLPHGFVLSPLEVAAVRERLASHSAWSRQDTLLVTPGIRFADGEVHDQKRVSTPAGAMLNGATHLVMGRPILQGDAVDNVARALKEIRAVWHEKL